VFGKARCPGRIATRFVRVERGLDEPQHSRDSKVLKGRGTDPCSEARVEGKFGSESIDLEQNPLLVLATPPPAEIRAVLRKREQDPRRQLSEITRGTAK
jgi:hypothetical protein